MPNVNDVVTKIEIKQARVAPSWLAWAGYGAVVALLVAYNATPALTWIPYALGGFTIVLVYLGVLIYNQFASYYNTMQIKMLGEYADLDDLIEQLSGTFQDEDGLTKGENENEERKDPD